MQINLSGQHVDITEGIREAVNTKFAKIEAHYPQMDRLDIYLSVERNAQNIEVNTQFMGAPVVVHASNQDLYVAIGESVKKLDAALKHRKGTVKSHLHAKPTLTDPAEEMVDDESPQY